MKSAVETLTPTRVKLTVEVPYEELKPSVDKALRSIGAQIQVPGFRKGKVPHRIIEQRVGRAAVMQEALDEALPDFYGQALQEHNVSPLGQPEIADLKVPMDETEEFSFVAEVDCRPRIELPDFTAISVEVDPVTLPEGAVEDRLEDLRKRFGTLKPVERAVEEGDFLTLNLSATIDGEMIDEVTDVSFEVGSRNMLEGLDDAVIGAVAGESKTFTAPLAGGDHAGREAECTVTVTAVKVRELPELDDDFAQLASEFDTLEELRADIERVAQLDGRYGQGMQARDKVLDKLRELMEIPVPEALIAHQVESHLTDEGRDEDDEHRAEVEKNAREAFATQFLLDEVAQVNAISVEQADFVEYLMMTAQQVGMQPNDFARVISEQGQMPMILGEVARRKALAYILEQVSVTDTDGNVVDLRELDRALADDESDDDSGEVVDAEVAGDDDTAEDTADDTAADETAEPGSN